MSFRFMAIVTSIAGSVLGFRFIFAGASVLNEWGVDATNGSNIVCRRLGAIYLGLALMFLLGRTAPPSELRSAVCLGVGGASALLASFGLLDLWAGRVGSFIIVPSIVELILAAGFIGAWKAGR